MAAAVGRIVVSWKPDGSVAGRLHNDTACAALAAPAPGAPNVAHRVPIQSLAGWSDEEVRTSVPDATLCAQILTAVGQGNKPAQAAALLQIPHAAGRYVRRVRVRERLDGTAAIRDRRTGRPYKLVKLDANHRLAFWRLLGRDGVGGKLVMLVVPMLLAAADTQAKRLREGGARKVFVDPIGRVRDPGPLAW